MPPTTTPMIKLAYPATRRDDVQETLHGSVVADPYRWLEDEKDPAVIKWLGEQDTAARAQIAAYPRRDEFAARLKEVFYFDAVSAPVHKKGTYVYSRKHANKEKNVVYWKSGENGTENVLFDPNTWADTTTALGQTSVSDNGKLVAYTLKPNNADEAVIHVKEIATGKELPDVIEGAKYASISWTPDSTGFYYTWVPPAGSVSVADRPGKQELRFHKLGTDPARDEVVFPATNNPQTFVGGGISDDGKWVIAFVQHGWNRSDVYFRSAKANTWTPLVKDIDATFEVTAWKDAFYVLTNHEAPRYRVFKVNPKKPARAAWREIVPQANDTLEGMSLVGERLVLNYLRKATSVMQVHDLSGKLVRTIDLPPFGTASGMLGNPDEDTAYFSFSSFTEPTAIFKTSIAKGSVSEWARVKLPINTSEFVTTQVMYPSRDGTQISMFLMHKKGITPNGKNPTILYGYGGFNVSLTPSFSSSRAVWLEQGGVYAIPNLRGGGEYGEEWHRAGMLDKKQNVFDDYIAAAKYLIDNQWTSPRHLAIHGGSNGGLLVGAAMTQAPELYRAVVCAVPLLDMVRYHLYGSGKTWIPEYGSADEASQFATLLAYSPYHRVKEGAKYPALLMDAADHDDRVDPMHARKFVAAIQHATTDGTPVLLRVEKNAGHGGADQVKAQVERNADMFAFLWAQLN